MLIYRVEKKNGTGPWCSRGNGAYNYSWHSEGSFCFPNQQAMNSEQYSKWQKHKRRTEFIFGFPNLLALFKYTKSPNQPKIKDCFKNMKEKGYYIVIYEVFDSSEVISDDSQLVFLPDEAVRVRRISPTSPFINILLDKYI